MFLDSRQDHVPEIWGSLKLVACDILEGIADLEISEMLRVLLEDIRVVLDTVAHHEC